jgi:hypothetical protein
VKRLTDFGDLVALFGASAGDWYWLLDADTQVGAKDQHPWILYQDFDPGRYTFAHGCLRTSTPANVGPTKSGVFHLAHSHGDGCRLDRSGQILPRVAKQIPSDWLVRGSYNCSEPDPQVLKDVQRELARRSR